MDNALYEIWDGGRGVVQKQRRKICGECFETEGASLELAQSTRHSPLVALPPLPLGLADILLE